MVKQGDFFEPVDFIPGGRGQQSPARPIVAAFMESEHDRVKLLPNVVQAHWKSANSAQQSFRMVIRSLGLKDKVRASIASGDVYLEKLV